MPVRHSRGLDNDRGEDDVVGKTLPMAACWRLIDDGCPLIRPASRGTS